MKPEKLSDLKKVLLVLNTTELTEICLRLAKYKKENKELKPEIEGKKPTK